MIGLALRSLRHRATALAAAFATVLLGAALVGSFATLVETAWHSAGQDAKTLTIVGAVVGGWGTVIVLFSVASTVGIVVTQRAAEIGLLRTIGATPRQAARMIIAEVLALTIVAALLGAFPAAVGGNLLLTMLRGRLISESVEFEGGPASLASAVILILLAVAAAAGLAARRATCGSASVTLRTSEIEPRGMPRRQAVVGWLLTGLGVSSGIVTITVTANVNDPYIAMSTAGSGAILAGIGLAVLAPALLRLLAIPLRPLLRGTASGELAGYNATRRPRLLAGVLAPVLVLTSAAIGTLMLVGIDHRTIDPTVAAGGLGETLNLLNNIVVGMISLFAAIMVVNAFASVVAHRGAELHRLWLVGATAAQVRQSVVAEAAIVAAVGVVLGAAASLVTVIPFSIVRSEGLVPDGQTWLPPLIAVAVTALTLMAAGGAVSRVSVAAGRP